MRFKEEKLKSFQTLDELEKEIFTPEEIEDLYQKAEKRSRMRRNLCERISKAVNQYMAENVVGFNLDTGKLDLKR